MTMMIARTTIARTGGARRAASVGISLMPASAQELYGTLKKIKDAGTIVHRPQ